MRIKELLFLALAILEYHVLNGTYYTEYLPETPSFIPTMLIDSSYTTITGGQVVEAASIDSNIIFFSGLFTNSTVTSAVSYIISSTCLLILTPGTEYYF